MEQYDFIDIPTTEEIEAITELYRGEDWWKHPGNDREMVRGIVSGSHCFMLVRCGKAMIAMGRAISDGASDAYIQDVTVIPSFRHRGIGTRIVEKLIDRLERDGINWIGLIAERHSSPFYERLGFSVMEDSSPMLRLKI